MSEDRHRCLSGSGCGSSVVEDGVVWRRHPVYTKYELGCDGSVRSFHKSQQGQVLRPTLIGHKRRQYLGVSISHYGKSRQIAVHTLVCEAFYGPKPTPKHEVRHLNDVPTDNRLVNLAWGTRSENALDQVRLGTHNMASVTHCPQGHEYTPENTRMCGPSRRCRECDRIKARAYHWKNREKRLAYSKEYHRQRKDAA